MPCFSFINYGLFSSVKRFLFILITAGTLVSGFASTSHCKTMVIFIGGWKMTPEQMASFSSSIPKSQKIEYLLPTATSELVRPWHCADLVYEFIKKNNLQDEELNFVSFSLGGIVVQWLLSSHPELRVKKLILVGTPVGGYKFVPPNNFFSNSFPKDLPIYVIAGNKKRDVWFLRDKNDGVVDLESVLDIQQQNLKEAAIFHADHTELNKMPEVQAKISIWLGLAREPSQEILTVSRSRLDSLTVSN